jgi:ADP-dependent NAD(P)H-hydrate dehydratase / NAD(P)H-hydrate epimerase
VKLATVAQMRELDRRTIEENGMSGDVLMDRAGQGVADIARRVAEIVGFYHPTIHLFAGRGNNGGDAFAAARHLKEMGLLVEVWLAGAANEVHGDALKHMSKMKSAGISVRELPTKEDWDQEMPFRAFGDVLVDGILGTGTTGPARGPAAGAIQYINAHSQDSLVVAIDVPSGLNADTGAAEGDVVRADVTVTMGLPKKGLVEPCALDYVGSVEVVDIGIPEEYVSQMQVESDKEMIYLTDLKPLFKRRPRASHKGNYGSVLLIGGARGYAGAIAMAARAAMRSGAGLVTSLVPESIAGIVAGASLESMVIGAKETSTGSLSAEIWSEWKNRIDDFDALLIGPGLTRNPQSLTLVRHVIRDCAVPLVLDADAISLLEGQPHWIERAKCPVVLTPHPGEMARLFSREVEEVQKDRCGVALAAARFTRSTVVLKGAGTVVAQDGKPLSINMTGNPGMATGGAGDVLAGMLASLLGQKLQPFDAARVAVYLHGRAGDTIVCRKSQAGLVAGDLIEEIPYVFRDLTLR